MSYNVCEYMCVLCFNFIYVKVYLVHHAMSVDVYICVRCFNFYCSHCACVCIYVKALWEEYNILCFMHVCVDMSYKYSHKYSLQTVERQNQLMRMKNQVFSKKCGSRVFGWPEAAIENLKGCHYLEWIFHNSIYYQLLCVDTNVFLQQDFFLKFSFHPT